MEHFSREDLEAWTLPQQIGGALGIDFVNTVSSWILPEPGQFFEHYGQLIAWNWRSGALSEARALELLAAAEQQPQAAERIFRVAINLRDALYAIFKALTQAAPPQADELRVLHTAYQTALPFTRLEGAPDGVRWQLGGAPALEQVLWPPAHSALELLASPQVARIKICANDETCGWLFLDLSKNGSRRWCDMNGCGTRDKMRRYYRRKHPEPPSAD